MTILESTTIERDEKILATDIGGETMMMDLEGGDYFNLSHVAHRIWQLIETPTTFADLIAVLHDEFNIDLDVCKKETLAFLEQMRDAGVIKLG